MWLGWVATALVVIAFWAVPIIATLMLFPPATRNRGHHRSGPDAAFGRVPSGGTRDGDD
jgi:hypothetical protein